MQSKGFKFFSDPDLNYALSAGDIKVSLNEIQNSEQTITFYFGAWDDYDSSTQTFTRKILTFGDKNTLLWGFYRLLDDGQGGTISKIDNSLVKEVAVTAPFETNVTEIAPATNIANFFYNDASDKHITSTTDYTLNVLFGCGEHKYGWSSATNVEAGGFRLAKRDPNNVANEIIMTREMRYGSAINNKDRYTTFNAGDALPTDGWYVKDFWAYTYPNEVNDDTVANDVISKLEQIKSGVPNAIRFDVTFALPTGNSDVEIDFAFTISTAPVGRVAYDEISL
ncbi:hypothetical protein JHD46_07835 [Sulfurimonas sp. SAG-AH-194-C20]|nr:hypothetical protein [Sulfurimonas sp. SAG-AH-194-C20]MDF1879543.1 hypothetical protein [Sulfurimonas sp. SAG-AH-194-C20]